jgi:hypothetical protein
MADAGSAAQQVIRVWEQPRAWPELKALAERLVMACDTALRHDHPDWLGHVKTLVVTAEGAAYASLTGAGEPITWRGTLHQPATRAEITLYAVVWGAPERLVQAVVAEALRAEWQGGP